MRTITVALFLALLTGCAGLETRWRLQVDMNYLTPADKPAPPARGASAAF